MQNKSTHEKKGNLKAFLLLGIFFLMMTVSYAQVRTITGTISASDTKETLPGATVQIKGTTEGVVTDINGKYTIKVPEGKVVLIFSFIGYATQEIELGPQNIVDVTLGLAKTTLAEVVVVGYGTLRKSDLTGSVSTIKTDELTKITAINPMESLEGKVAGVQVMQSSGTPGEAPVVLIRGIGTLNDASPIYVVDGVILNDISYLNSSDIESMTVLKDASATAIYGNRGANGVIMITTKSGKAEEGKTTFTVNAETGWQKVAREINMLNGKQFATVMNEISPGSYNNIDAVPNTDWQKLIFHLAPMYNFEGSVSGAGKTSQYYVGVGYFDQEGIIDKSYYRRFNLKIDNTYELTKDIKLGNNITVTPFSQQVAPDVTYEAYRALPTIQPYNSVGYYNPVPGVGNPLADLAYSNNTNKGIRATGNIFGEVTFLKNFVVRSSYGIDAQYIQGVNFTPAFTVSPTQYNLFSALTKAYTDYLDWLWENTISYKKDFGKQYLDVVAGYTMENETNEIVSLTGQNIIRDNSNFWYIQPNYIVDPSNNINNVSKIQDGVDASKYFSMISYLIRVNYTLFKKYVITLTYRRDGSSKFSTSNRWGDFPSAALAWNLSEEKFMSKIKWLSKLKLRGSWGILGNDKIPYLSRYSLVDNSIVSVLGINPAAIPGASYGAIGNNNLKWETTSQVDVGLEAGFFKDRLTAEFDYYDKETYGILVPLTIPAYFGNGLGTTEYFNAAKVQNRGFEGSLSWRDQVGKFKYGVSVNGTTIANKVLSIGGISGSDTVLYGGYLGNGLPVTASRVGLPIGAFYGYKTNGVFQSQAEINASPHLSDAVPGDLKFVDVNGDGKIDNRDRTYLGSPIPKFIFGCSINFEYMGVDLAIDIQGQTGNKIFNAKAIVRPDQYNYESRVLGAWTGPGTSYTEPRATSGGDNYLPSDYFVQDGSFMRIRDLVIGYTLPNKITKKAYIQKLRIYLKGDNLFTWTKYTGYTPEIGSSSVLSNGVDYGAYPITSVYSIGLNLNF
ncbi:MAG: TonB-dependent receptor [Bacteroidales bacterium]|jgi:TonB-linked SusC/RagA family outer membrane protein